MKRTAVIKGAYRYSLLREWDSANSKRVSFLMLNPSTADDQIDDPTTKVCIQFAKRWGFGSLEIVNLFAYRATNPLVLKKIPEKEVIIGPENHFYLQKSLEQAHKIIVAWGKHGEIKERYQDEDLRTLLSKYKLHCFKILKNHQPKHPLMVAYSTPLMEYPFYSV